jgi:hypothetical protein
VSSISSPSSSSTSSNYGYLETPTNLQITAVTPSARTISISWDWTGSVVPIPTGFIVERQVNNGAFEIISYSVDPLDRSYDDVMPEDVAIRVFAYGQQLAYRVKVYWIP